MLKKLYCIKDIYDYKKGELYKYREEDEYSIYIYSYSNCTALERQSGRIGTKFSMVNDPNFYTWLDYYKLYFCTLSEMRKFKLEKLENIK